MDLLCACGVTICGYSASLALGPTAIAIEDDSYVLWQVSVNKFVLKLALVDSINEVTHRLRLPILTGPLRRQRV